MRVGDATRLSATFYTIMGLGRLELPTSRLSGVCSNHLSYRPSHRTIRTIVIKSKRARRHALVRRRLTFAPKKMKLKDPVVCGWNV